MLNDIKLKIKNIPSLPGVYLMKDKENNIIYIGKSKCLDKRVKSYFVNSSSHSKKVQRLVKTIYEIEIITTDTELDALLLECKLIKKYKPMYNKLMKNHENYSYLKINNNIEFPYIEVTNSISDSAVYYGPYMREAKLDEIKDIINETLKIRQCKRMSKCFKYDLNRCEGPCRGKIKQKEYNKLIDKLISDLKGNSNYIIEALQETLQIEIKNLNFEKAAQIQDSIQKINRLLNRQAIINNSDKEILAWIKISDNSDYKLYVIKNGRLIKSEIINYNTLNTLDKEKYLKITLEKYKDEDENKEIEKSDIDFINIIYNYIKYNKDIEYISK
ncbi:MAG: GIY-YIG nuclease family protein [Peptostreptococcaceae bacterium]